MATSREDITMREDKKKLKGLKRKSLGITKKKKKKKKEKKKIKVRKRERKKK